ncbi:MAG: FecR domain-containing protein [Acidobacteria bacterium]|nr:FecR domain-containing protein [Acidobacteriota bacterium]
MKRKRAVYDFVEWKTIPFRAVRFWVIVILLLLLVVSLWLLNRYGLPDPAAGSDQPLEMLAKRAARFMFVDGSVKVKPLSDYEWVQADQVKELYPGDLIKTDSNSSCRIVFFDGTVYEVKPDSLISILESYEDRSSLKRLVNVELADGALDLSTGMKESELSSSKVETSTAFADVGENTSASAVFDSQEGVAEFRVDRGEAEVTNKQSRESLRLVANEGVTAEGEQLKKTRLPDRPSLLVPRHSEVFTSNNPQSMRITLRWQEVPEAQRYRVTIATDSKFYPVLQETEVTGRDHLTLSGLPYGIYYWRVVAIDRNSIEGYPSMPTGMFAVRPKKLNPADSIRFDLKRIVVIGNILEIFGETDADNIVYINNKKVRLEPDGSFTHFTEPFTGMNEAKLDISVKDYSGAVRKITKTIPLE